jgi:uncharacterized surface protein with fasciclin (FAS1) repeats
MPMRDIIETVRATVQLKTLLSALGAADLSETLSGPGPLTFFAPVEEAFQRLPAGRRRCLLLNKWELRRILKCHIMTDIVTMADLEDMGLARMMNDRIFDIVVHKDGIHLDGAMIIRGDTVCSNGIVHFIDAVIIPDEI